MKKFRPVLIYFILLLVTLVSFINILFTYHAFTESRRNNNDLYAQLTGESTSNSNKIKDAEDLINRIAEKVTEIQNQSYPVPKDGEKGEKGDSVKGDTGERGEKGERGDKGDRGEDGKTPELRCNAQKNRWEVRYGEDLGWEVPNGQPQRCTITPDDILKVLLKL